MRNGQYVNQVYRGHMTTYIKQFNICMSDRLDENGFYPWKGKDQIVFMKDGHQAGIVFTTNIKEAAKFESFYSHCDAFFNSEGFEREFCEEDKDKPRTEHRFIIKVLDTSKIINQAPKFNLQQIPKLPQRQDSITDQLKDLVMVANKLGLYDAADAVRMALLKDNL